jgi:hypothetical protein
LVLVLVPDNGPALIVHHGERVPDARFGVYQGAFLVDTTEHRIVLPMHLASRSPAFAFHCRAIDPAEVVARGIRDVTWHAGTSSLGSP